MALRDYSQQDTDKLRYWYRTMFDEHFPPHCASTVMRWTPTWSKQTDPSGRFVLDLGAPQLYASLTTNQSHLHPQQQVRQHLDRRPRPRSTYSRRSNHVFEQGVLGSRIWIDIKFPLLACQSPWS